MLCCGDPDDFCWCFYFSGQLPKIQNCRVCLPCGEWVCSSNLSPVLWSLAEVLGFCPVCARFRAQLEVWMEFIHSTWDFASLALFLISHYLWLLWTLWFLQRESLGFIFQLALPLVSPLVKAPKLGNLSHPSPFSQFLTSLQTLPAFVHFR